MARPGKELIEAIVAKVSETPESLREAGYLGKDTEGNSRNMKSAATRYRKALEKDEGFFEAERKRFEGQLKVKDSPQPERPIVDPEELEDSVIMGHKGDTTKTGATVTEFDGVELDEPVTTFGGPKFGLQFDNQSRQLYWASMDKAARPFQNKAEALQSDLEMPVNAIYVAMGKEGNYFNQAFADAMIQATRKNTKISDKALDEFDKDMRVFREDWVGIRSPDARAQLLGVGKFPMDGAGKLRSEFVKRMNKAGYREQGFPSVERLLTAFTEPDLLGAQLGDAGYSIGQVGMDYGLEDITTHPSYNTGIGGLYRGGFERSVPVNILFPDAWQKLATELTKPKKGGKPRPLTNAEKVDAISKRKDLYQIADARWVDTVKTWLRNNPGKDNGDAIKAIGLPTAALFLLDPGEAQAAAAEAVYAGVERDLTEDERIAIRDYVRMQQAFSAVQGVTPGMVADPNDIALDQQQPDPDISFVNDDVDPGYLAEREPMTDDLLLQFEGMTFDEPAVETDSKPNPFTDIPAAFQDVAVPAVEGAASAAGDFLKGIVVEGPTAVVAGFLDATAEMAKNLEAIIPLGTISGAEPEYLQIETRPDTVTGEFVRNMSQFMTGFIPAARAFKVAGLGNIASGMAGGAVADAFVFDPQEERFSNLLQGTPLETPFTNYLAASPDDTRAEGMFKNAVEGVFLGGAVEAVMGIARSIKRAKAVRDTAAAEDMPPEQLVDDGLNEIEAKGELAEQGTEPAVPGTGEAVEEMPAGQEFIPFSEALETAQVEFKVPQFATGTTKAAPDTARNINLGNLNTVDDVKTLIDEVAKADAENINQARREKITNEELEGLADNLGMTVEDLLNRRQGVAPNAEEALAARRILVASGENLIRMAKEAKNGSEQDLALFKRAMAQHRAIQAQVSGMTAEAGRALQSFNIAAKSAKEQELQIKELLAATGGEGQSRQVAAMIAELSDPAQIAKVVKDGWAAKSFDVIYEVWINGLLSGPTTHSVNVISNIMTSALTVSERKMASALGNSVAPDEADAMIMGAIEGARDGFRLAWNALKTGEPSDQLNKLEAGEKHRAISAANLELSGNLGRAVDLIGNIVRIPGNLLTASDEFFKSVGYRMELQAQAYRTAFNEGLTDERAALRVQQILDNPPENIKREAVNAMRYNTFTNSLDETKIGALGEIGKFAEQARGSQSPFIRVPAKVILPFLRTPTNIASFTLERTPLAFASRAVRADIAAGGARRDLALAKISLGSLAMGTSANLALQGQITGGGPQNRDLKNMMRAKGWQPYSVLVNGKYYAYNRLDPVGALLGLAADITDIAGELDEPTMAELAMAATVAVASNMSSKTYLKGLSEFNDVMSSIQIGDDKSNTRFMNWLNRQGASLTPFSSTFRSVERMYDPTLRSAFTFTEQLKSQIPGYSEDLPPRRNIFGEPIVLNGGIGLDTMAGIYTSELEEDPVIDEIVAQKVGIPMPRKSIDGVELDVYQYDRYIQLMSGMDGAVPPVKEQLSELFSRPEYQGLGQEQKEIEIRAVFQDAQKAARAQLMQEDDELRTAIIQQEYEEQRRRMGRQ